MKLRGYGQDESDSNGGEMQRHFVELRGYGHDESVPYAWRNECGQMQPSLNRFDGMNVDKYNHH